MAETLFLTITVLSVFMPALCIDDTLHEELFIKPLQNGHVYTHFQFTTVWNTSYEEDGYFEHFHLFPKPLGEVLKMWKVEELHLSQTQGLWRWDKWDYPLQEAPPGAELWAWFHKDTLDVDKAWRNLINMLSGMFCASLNFMDSGNTVSPKWSFRPEGVSSHGGFKKYLRYASLPREMVCTENLTPWKKLLPCAARSGLGSLFNALKLFDASYTSVGVHFRHVCRDDPTNTICTKTAVELRQTLSVVFEPILSTKSQDWSLKRLFNRMLSNVCPLAKSSFIFVDITKNKTEGHSFSLTPEPEGVEQFKTAKGEVAEYAVYEVDHYVDYNRVLNIASKYSQTLEYRAPVPPMVYAHQYQTGYGQEKGGVLCLIYNRSPTETVSVLYMQTLPWFLRLYLHTLRIEHFPVDMHMSVTAKGNETQPKSLHYIPGRDHQQPYFLEVMLQLPPLTVTRLSFQFDRALLKWTEYPPDANHGFYVSSAVITTPLPPDWTVPQHIDNALMSSMFSRFGQLTVLRIHTEHLLILLPTPDFSMPYNVICLACTVIAIAFGSIHNLTTRRFVVYDPKIHKGLKGRLSDLLRCVFRKKKQQQQENNEEDVKTNDDELSRKESEETKKS